MTARQQSRDPGPRPLHPIVLSRRTETTDGLRASAGFVEPVTGAPPAVLRQPRVTGRDVAVRAGVSTATVSLALGRHALRLAPATRQRVLTAASELGYTPNRVAQSLRRQRTGILVALVPALESAYYTDLLEGARQEASERDYLLAVVEAHVPPQRQAALQFLHGGVADGVLVANHVDELREDLQDLRRRGTPVVAVLGSALEPAIPLVTVDGEGAAFTATRHLIEHGHARVAHLTILPATPTGWGGTDGRLHGYRRALEESGITFEPELVVVASRSDGLPQAGAAAVQTLLAGPGPIPTAIFAYNDLMTVGIVHALKKAGIRVPDDVAVVGHDGIELGKFTTPPLTTIAHPRHELGARALGRLVDLIQGRRPQTAVEMLQAKLVRRQSCGCT